MKPSYYVAVSAYRATGGVPLFAREGEHLKLETRESEWPGWIWCTAENGVSAWVPESWVECRGQSCVMVREYSSVELTIHPGDELSTTLIESGWAWATTSRGKSGWVPLRHLEKTGGGPVKRVAAKIGEILRLLYAILLSFLPEQLRMRRIRDLHLNPSSVSAMTGIILFVGGLVFFFRSFIVYVTRHAEVMAGHVGDMDTGPGLDGGAVSGLIFSGLVAFITFFFTPIGILAVYIVLNGFARLATYLVTENGSLGDPIVWGIYAAGGLLSRRVRDERKKTRAGPVLPDRFIQGGDGVNWDLLVQSTREKKEWRESLSVRIGDDFYRLVGRYEMKEPVTGRLRFCYQLKKMSIGDPIRAYIEHREPE